MIRWCKPCRSYHVIIDGNRFLTDLNAREIIVRERRK